jgi:hypothetical protein
LSHRTEPTRNRKLRFTSDVAVAPGPLTPPNLGRHLGVTENRGHDAFLERGVRLISANQHIALLIILALVVKK